MKRSVAQAGRHLFGFGSALLCPGLALWLAGCSVGAMNHQAGSASVESAGLGTPPASSTVNLEQIDRRAYAHFVDGVLSEGTGELAEAEKSYRKALGIHPESYEIAIQLAHVLYRLRKPIEAIDVLDKIRPQDPAVLEIKASCYLMLGDHRAASENYVRLVQSDSSNVAAFRFLARFYRNNQNLDSTVWAYRHLSRLKPDDYDTLNELGRLLRHREDMTGAKEAFWRSIKNWRHAANIQAVIGLGEIYDKLDQTDSLAIVLQLGLELDSTNILLNEEIGRLYLKQDSIPQAIPHFRIVAERSPDKSSVSRRLAVLYLSIDSLSQADSILSSLVAGGERVAGNHYYLGRIAAQRSDYETARDQFTLLTQLADTVDESWLDLAYAYRQLDDTANELATYRAGLDHMHDEGSAIRLYFALGAAFERTGFLDSAIVAFEEILQHDPDHAQTLNYLGYALADNNIRLEYARDLIERAYTLQPDNAAYLDSFGWVYFRLGNYASALHYLQAAAELDNDPVILDHLGDAHDALGHQQEARKWWLKALEQQPDNAAIREKLDR